MSVPFAGCRISLARVYPAVCDAWGSNLEGPWCELNSSCSFRSTPHRDLGGGSTLARFSDNLAWGQNVTCARTMPLQNRVTPLGELIADPARGLVYGNRGCLHDEHGRIRRRFNGRRWIACRLQFRGWRRRQLLAPGRFTELFFLDEATAFAAGHRPCALCRHEDYVRFGQIWREHHPDQAGADAIDAQLHSERVAPGTRAQLRHDASLDGLPDATFVLLEGAPWLVLGAELMSWSAAGYLVRRARPVRQQATLVTPPSLVAVLRAGWHPAVPLLHPSALAPARAGV